MLYSVRIPEGHPSNTSSGKFPSNQLGMDTCVNEEHPAKAPSPICFTDTGIVTLVNDVQSAKADAPMFVTVEGMLIDDKAAHPSNAWAGISVVAPVSVTD